MIRLTLKQLEAIVERTLHGERTLDELRAFLFLRHESEEDVEVEPELEELLPVLEPYAEYEEAMGDSAALERLARLQRVLNGPIPTRERVVFALKYDTIMVLTSKLERGVIDDATFERQLAALSPAPLDTRRIRLWARAHLGLSDLDAAKMS